MKKRIVFVWNILLLALCTMQAFAQSDSLLPYPAKNLIFPKVAAEVLRISDRYAFRYSIANGQAALQSIHKFMIELKAPVEAGSPPPDWSVWNMSYDTLNVLIWFSADSAADIPAGQITRGFRFETAGLPRINRCWLRAWETVRGREGQYDPASASIFRTSLQGATLGPVDPPTPLVYLPFLDTLLSYTRQSADLGWLGKQRDNDCDEDERPDDGIVKNIELRLQKAKRELAKGDSVQARKELEKLLQKVERIWKRSQEEEKKHKRDRWERNDNVIITSEAYALLKYNSEYLIDRLPDKSKHSREDDKDKKPKK